MTNATQTWTFSKTLIYASTLASAEWIQEAPSSSAGILPLAKFSSFAFTPSANGKAPTLANTGFGNAGLDSITMVNPYGQTSSPSPSVGAGLFTTCWGDNIARIVGCPSP
jgi:hypothetical protein